MERDISCKSRRQGEEAGGFAQMVAQMVRVAALRFALDRPQPDLRGDLFRPPERPGDQLTLV